MDMKRDQRDDDLPEDTILQRALSESPYERKRVEAFSHFKQPIPRKLTIQGALLGSLVLLLPLYSLYPAEAAAYLPSMDPVVASPKVLLLGAFGASIEVATAVLLVGVALYRVKHEPVTEEEARTLFNVETFASYLGFGTGGLVIALTLGFFTLGMGGESALMWYVDTMNGRNPFTGTGTSFSVGHLAAFALAGALAIAIARGYVATALGSIDT